MPAHDLQQRIEAGHRYRPAVHQPGADLHHPLERVAGPERVLAVQPLGMQQRQTSQQLGVQTVGLGVLVVVGPQVRGLLGWDHDHRRTPAAEPARQGDPGVAGWFHHHHDVLGVGRQPRPQRLELIGIGMEPVADEQHLAVLVRARRLVRRATGDVDTESDLHVCSPRSSLVPARLTAPADAQRTRHSLSGIRRQDIVVGHRVLNRAHVLGAAPDRPHDQQARSQIALLRSDHSGNGQAPAHAV